MPGGHTLQDQVWAGCTHRVALPICGDAADLVKVAVDEQHRHIKLMLGQPWRKIINGPSAGPRSM